MDRRGDETIRMLREQLSVLRDEARENTRILKLAQQRELRLLNADSLNALFVEMTEGLRLSHGLDAVSLILLDPQHEIRHLANTEGDGPAEGGAIQFADSLAGLAPQFASLYRSWLGPFVAADHQLLASLDANVYARARPLACVVEQVAGHLEHFVHGDAEGHFVHARTAAVTGDAQQLRAGALLAAGLAERGRALLEDPKVIELYLGTLAKAH